MVTTQQLFHQSPTIFIPYITSLISIVLYQQNLQPHYIHEGTMRNKIHQNYDILIFTIAFLLRLTKNYILANNKKTVKLQTVKTNTNSEACEISENYKNGAQVNILNVNQQAQHSTTKALSIAMRFILIGTYQANTEEFSTINKKRMPRMQTDENKYLMCLVCIGGICFLGLVLNSSAFA